MLRRRMKSDRGAAVVEFALVVPMLIALVFGIAEFGWAFFNQATLAGAAREGARAMALENPPANGPAAGTTAAQKALTASEIPSGPVLTPGSQCPAASATPGNATFTIDWDMPTITGLFGSTFHLRGIGVMRCNG